MKLNYAFLPAQISFYFMNMSWFYSCKYICIISEMSWMNKNVLASIRFLRWEALM